MIRQHFDTSMRKWRFVFIGLAVALVVVFILSLMLGSVNIPLSQSVNFLIGRPLENAGWQAILMNFRLPKALTAVLVGAALGLSGLQMRSESVV